MIFDCFTFFNELDILEARLNELYNVVDRFVLVEATETFQGNPKPLYFSENRSRFKVFDDKIIHIVAEFPPGNIRDHVSTKPINQAWARQYYQRDQFAKGLVGAEPDDLIIVSDVDEIIKAETLIEAVASRMRDELTIFFMPIYWGSATRRVHDAIWDKGPRMISYRQFTTGQKLRKTKVCASRSIKNRFISRSYTRIWNWINTGIHAPFRTIDNSGWHLTSLGGWDNYRKKLSSISQSDLVGSPAYADENSFWNLLETTTYEVPIEELPRFIQRNRELFEFNPMRH